MGKIVRIKNLEIGHGRPKLCAIVLGETEEEIIRLAQAANEADCDLLEFRADHYSEILDIGKAKSILRKLKKTIKKPLIFTFRRFEEGGKARTDTAYYKELLLMTAQNSLADIIDLELSAGLGSDFIKELKASGSYVILSLHDFNRTPGYSQIMDTFEQMEHEGADIIKVAYMPNSKKDVLNLMCATEEATSNYSTHPIIAISMGHLGLITRLLCEFTESAVTFASITRASAPGQINIDSLEKVLDVIHENFKRVFLIGFMGSGKTAAANVLAGKYGLTKIDLDAYIEQKEGMSISEIFSSYSEDVFRDKETKYLRRILGMDYQVVSLGGGAVLRQENAEMIRQKGIIVFLKAGPDTIARRIKDDKTRPLIADNLDLDYIKDLMKQREEKYIQLADLVIETDNRTLDDICREIVEKIGFTL